MAKATDFKIYILVAHMKS